MKNPTPKALRRALLQTLYEHYMRNPMQLMTPADLHELGFTRDMLLLNMHYLGDRNLAEVAHSPTVPFFNTVRITADGIDLVEQPFEFGRRFPPDPDGDHPDVAELPHLLEQLVAEVDLSPLQGEVRLGLQRDVNYLRDEIARPQAAWRGEVIQTVLNWMTAAVAPLEEDLASLQRIRQILAD